MDFNDTPQEGAFRKEVRTWLEANAKPKSALGFSAENPRFQRNEQESLKVAKVWQAKKAEKGYARITWPKENGGLGGTPMQQVIYSQEEAKFDVPSGFFEIGLGMCIPTVTHYASKDVAARYVKPALRGEEIWCQLFSEPSAGSDVAGLRTRAEKDGDDWVINGQKVWTSGAHYSDYGIVLTRTDPNVPKHKGLTMFYVSMKSPGIEVRPIKQMSGGANFNEVYFTNVRIPDSQRLGNVGDGWRVSLTTLMNERLSIGAGVKTGFDELFDFCCTFNTGDGLAVDDPAVRSKLATWAARASGLRYTGYRSISAHSKGENPGPENSIGKLVAGQMLQEVAMFALDLQGQAGVVTDPAQAQAAARFQAMLLWAPAMRIAGGTDEILRNIIAERVLGLPADMRADRGIAFNKIPTRN